MIRALAAVSLAAIAGLGLPHLSADPPPYHRSEFGNGWADVDRDGCNTRAETLMRAMSDESVRDAAHGGCLVLAGTFTDPYTRVRSSRDAGDVDIDHVVSLADAWRSGAWRWPAPRRVAFANDPDNLVPTDLSTNRSKGDQDPSTWLPANHSASCWYVAKYESVKAEWNLSLTAEQEVAITSTEATC